MSKVINFFATRPDLLDLLNDVESKQSIQYVEAGLLDSPTPRVYGSCMECPGIGRIRIDNTNLGAGYLIIPKGTPVAIEAVPQRRGGIKYAVDQGMNPNSVDMLSGGQYDKMTVVAGRIGTCTDSTESAALLKTIRGLIHKRWERIRSYWVGPEAAKILDRGGRLTANLGSPSEYDLQREPSVGSLGRQ